MTVQNIMFFQFPKLFFWKFQQKKSFLEATESGSRKEIIFSYVIQNRESCFENSSRSCSKLVTACLRRMRSPTCLYIHLYCAEFCPIRSFFVTNLSILIYITWYILYISNFKTEILLPEIWFSLDSFYLQFDVFLVPLEHCYGGTCSMSHARSKSETSMWHAACATVTLFQDTQEQIALRLKWFQWIWDFRSENLSFEIGNIQNVKPFKK